MTLPRTTPYDDDRAAYSRAALARLALCAQAVHAASRAQALVATRNDVDTGPGGRVSEAVSVGEAAERLLARAVVYERERGASWAEIGHYLGLGAAQAEGRWTAELDRWSDAFEVPYELDPTGRKRVPRLPRGAYDPRGALWGLDLWAGLHVTTGDRHAVSGGLTPCPVHAERELGGAVHSAHLRTFLEVLSGYLVYEFDDTDWDTVALGIEDTDDEEDVTGWYDCPLEGGLHAVRVHLARCRPFPEDDDGETDLVSVRVTGVYSADLWLRVDTLITAL
ncbi:MULTISPECIES: hypothetical protein [unclassified Streptomyces]|uniref:hypothetical protein n=1 Tax=unclassified Streptomyces TaxID=2593676 RepID=UPI0036E76520